MKISIPKLKAMILFFGKHTNPDLLGKVKLMKLFYFADFGHLKKHGAPITYDIYLHLDHGPVPSAIMGLVNQVEDDYESAVLSDTISIASNNRQWIHKIRILRDFEEKDSKYFSPAEIKTLRIVCQRFKNEIGKTMEEISHKEAAWLKTGFAKPIPYSLAAEDNDSLVDKETILLFEKIVNS